MTVTMIVIDNSVDGAFPVKCNLSDAGDRVLLEFGSSPREPTGNMVTLWEPGKQYWRNKP